ncbi:MAG: hypothetical protein ACT4N2_10280 [Hyphomicrobium sp.]
MLAHCRFALALAAASAIIMSTSPAAAGRFDGRWTMVATTARGHCGTIPIGLGIKGGRVYATGGSYAFYPIKLSGRVADSGHARITAVTGPRIARGTGRFAGAKGSGTWKGKGPSGLCSGVWRAVRG